jgi:hypothetical protein
VRDNIKQLLQRPEEDKPTGINGVIEETTENPKRGSFFNYGSVLILIISGTIISIRIKKNTDFKHKKRMLFRHPLCRFALFFLLFFLIYKLIIYI